MPKFDFSTEEQQVCNLALDLARNEFSLEGEVTKRDLEQKLRDTINNDILGGKTLFQAYRRNKLVLFEIIEEIVTTAIGEDIMNSPFIDAFVEVKNRALGDNTAFYSEGGMLSVASFAGNHWDTNRQSIDLGEEFTLPKEWYYIHVYDELERFLLGIASLDKLVDKVYKAINKYMSDRIYAQFQNVANSVPAEFTASGNTEEALGDLCDLVQAAGGYGSLTIAGTKAALRHFVDVVPDKTFANSQKEAKASTGTIGEWEGNKLMVIPQTLKSGTFELALSKKQVFIMGADVKPIKLEFIGDTRTTEYDETNTNDMTRGLQIQTQIGMGMLLPQYFGVFNFA